MTALAFVFFVISVLVSTYNTSAQTPTITLSVSTGPPNTILWVNGTNFGANRAITIYWDQVGMGNIIVPINAPVNSNNQGEFSAQISIPNDSYGTHNIIARDTQNNQATATFFITPLVSINPISGAPGTGIQITASGFSANSQCTILWNGTPWGNTQNTNNNGYFQINRNAPNVPYGSHLITVIDGNNHVYSVSFFIRAALWFNPNTGVPGTSSTFNMRGFSGNTSFILYYDYTLPSEQIVASGITDATGSATGSFLMPESSNGQHTLTAVDIHGVIATNNINIQQKVNFTPFGGSVGDIITFDGHGFTALSNITVLWDGNPIPAGANITSGQNATFWGNFTIPYTSGGVHEVIFTDSSSVSYTVYIPVNPAVVLSRQYGLPNTTISFTATGFSPNSQITLTWDPGLPTGVWLNNIMTNSTGCASGNFTIPATAFNGTHRIVFQDSQNLRVFVFLTVGPLLSAQTKIVSPQ
ncbi:MAG: hypothetical protein QW728_07340, partial [Thermoplasmata archaeon]